MLPHLAPFLAGAVTMGFGLSGLAFLRLWMRWRDRLFLAFAGAFWLLMVPSLGVLLELPEADSWIYLFRVAAYLLIIVAIVLKNRRRLGRLARNSHTHPAKNGQHVS